MEQRNLEQRCAIKFCVKLGESASVTYEKLKHAYGKHSLSRAQVFRWHKSFLEGREHVEDEHRSGRPSTSKTDENIERVNTLVRSDRRLTLRMLSEQLNLNRFTVHQILTEHDRQMDNAPCHTAFSIAEFLTSKGIPVVPQPPYSPDLSPCDFFLFPTLKNVLKGRHFGTLENIQKSVTDMLKTISVEDFQRCYQQWEQRLHRCVAAQGNYFEGDNIDV